MRSVLLPLIIVLLPQVALSTLQLGIPVLAPAFVIELGLRPEFVGLIVGCVGLGSVWMFAANRAVTPVLGPLRALIAACLLSIVGAILILVAWLPAICAGAVLIGFAYAITAPAGSQILSAHVPKKRWGTVFSIRQAGVPLGGAIAGVVGAGIAAALGWRAGLVCLLTIPLVCALMLMMAPGRFRSEGARPRFEWAGLLRPTIFATPFRALASMPQLIPLAFTSLGFAAVQSSIFSFFPTFLIDGLGVGLALSGTLFAAMQISSFGGRLAIGFVADRIGAIRPVLMSLSIAAAACCALLALVGEDWSDPALFAVAAITGLSAAAWNGLFLAEIARLVTPDQVSEATAGVTFFTFIAYMLTPPAFALAVHLSDYQTAYTNAHKSEPMCPIPMSD